ncbi:MAG: winged helix-turn-helix domain-containing protein [Oscillospiraceae bacterium]|nr:winged helix-turn-helix domain-containing protein [Oscillospiraceae bacterium]
MTTSFSMAVLRAQVNAQLCRGAAQQPAGLETDPFHFNFDRMEFRKNGVPVELSKTEQKLLRLLVEHRGQILERCVLLDRIWTDGATMWTKTPSP